MRASTFRLSVAALGLAVPLLSVPVDARAGGFFIQEQSVKGVGRAFAGQSALPGDGSSLFFNPAIATRLGGLELGIGGYWISGQTDFENQDSRLLTPATAPGGGIPITGSDGDDPIGAIPLSSLYLAFPLAGERLWAGLSVNAPFGLATEYSDAWFGRYDSIKSELRTIDIGPTLAYALTPELSIGASLSIQYAEAELANALPNPLAVPGPGTDGRLQIEGNDWSLGVNVGLLWEPLEELRLGLAYRSGIEHELDGHARFSGLTGPLAAGNGRFSGSAPLELPDMVLLGAAYDLTPSLTVLGQVNWFRWSQFEEIRVELNDGRTLLNEQDFENSASAALGFEYRWTDTWTLRAGVQFDETPIPGGMLSTRTPDGDRFWGAVGLTVELRPGVELDFAYAHIWVDDAEIDRTETFFAGTPLASSARTRASSGASIDVIGVQLNYRF